MVGLGNPGSEFAGTLHNVGAETVELLATRAGTSLRAEKGLQARAAVIRRGDKQVALAIPTTYMNESGLALRGLTKRYGIDDPTSIVVVHDELDLAPGTVRVKVGGGLAGHNGLRSIKAHLHDDDFVRVRIGVGKPPSSQQGPTHVLNRPPKAVRALNSTWPWRWRPTRWSTSSTTGPMPPCSGATPCPEEGPGRAGSVEQVTSAFHLSCSLRWEPVLR